MLNIANIEFHIISLKVYKKIKKYRNIRTKQNIKISNHII